MPNESNDKAAGTGALTGTIIGYACMLDLNSPPPDGWLFCDGSAISREVYADLFEVVGTLHGSGDGVNTFNLPDYRGKFLRGVDDGVGRDPDAATRLSAHQGGAAGDKVGSVQAGATALPAADKVFTTNSAGAHTHSVPHLPKDSSWYSIAGSHYASWNSGAPESSEAGAHTHTINGGGDAESRPINIYVNYIISYGTKNS